MMETSPFCDTFFLKKEKIVCEQFLSVRIVLWRNEAEVNI